MQRCDGAKPACAQCARARKGEACQYDDGKGKTRTQALREKILQLEEKIQQMQDPDYTSPSITLHDPHTHLYSSSSSSSASGSPISAAASVAQSPYSSFGASHRSLYSRALLNVYSSEDSPQAPWAQPRVSNLLPSRDLKFDHRDNVGVYTASSPTGRTATRAIPNIVNSVFDHSNVGSTDSD